MTGILVRASVAYLFLLLVVRAAGKQPLGRATAFDWLVALMLGDFADDAILGETPLLQGAAAVLTITALHLGVGFLAMHWHAFERIVGAPPRVVLRDGATLHDATRREHLSAAEYDGMLRLESVDDPRDVAIAQLEPDGVLSVQRLENTRPATARDRAALRRLFD